MQFLIVEDSIADLKQAIAMIQAKGHDAIGVQSLGDALKTLENKQVDVMLTDIHLTAEGTEGLTLLKDVKNLHPDVLSIAMSSDPNVDLLDRALAYGARQFIRKPLLQWDDIAIACNLASKRRHLENSQISRNNPAIPKRLAEKYPDGIVIDAVLRQQLVETIHFPEIPIVIHGETGTGKEEAAKIVHRARCLLHGDIPFVAVNCSHLRTDLAQSKLFGHKRGAFTGAAETTDGYIGAANGGILFLDELQNLHMSCQQDLLRTLNDGTYQRVGDTKTLRAQFQVIVASTEDIDDAVEDGRILIDLRSRLTGLDFSLAPLRKRVGDMSDLIEMFFVQNSASVSPSEFKKLVAKCSQYYWQGNVRLLHHALRVLLMHAQVRQRQHRSSRSHQSGSEDGSWVRADDLPEYRLMLAPKGFESSDCPDTSASQPSSEAFGMEEPEQRSTVRGLVGGLSQLRGLSQVSEAYKSLLDGEIKLSDLMTQVERSVIQTLVEEGKKSSVIHTQLGISRSSFTDKKRRLGIH